MTTHNTHSNKATEDLLLIKEAKEGNEKAFASIMNRYKDSIYYTLLKMVGNSYDAEDLTIEAFGKAFRNLNSYNSKYAFSTWLFKIATNNCVDFIRRRQTAKTATNSTQEEKDSMIDNIQSDTDNPEESLINHQNISVLKNIVNQLKPRYKSLIELRYYKEYSYEEIASELNIPIGTVKAQLYRAKTLLYNILIKSKTKIK